MEIITGNQIYLKGLDVIEANQKSTYNKETTKQRKDFDNKKFVALDDLLKVIDELEKDGCNSGSGFNSYKLKEELKK